MFHVDPTDVQYAFQNLDMFRFIDASNAHHLAIIIFQHVASTETFNIAASTDVQYRSHVCSWFVSWIAIIFQIISAPFHVAYGPYACLAGRGSLPGIGDEGRSREEGHSREEARCHSREEACCRAA